MKQLAIELVMRLDTFGRQHRHAGGDTADQRNTVFEGVVAGFIGRFRRQNIGQYANAARGASTQIDRTLARQGAQMVRSEEHTSELQSLMRISYAVFCLQ